MKNELSARIRNILLLFGSTLSVMAGAVVTPSLPSMTEYFASIGNIEFLTKLILSVPPLFIAIFSPIAGYLFEKYGRKNVLIISSLLYGISGTTGFYVENIYLILAGRALMGVSIAGLMTGFIVLIGDLFENEKLSKFIGIQGAVMSLGGVVYLILGGILADIRWNAPFLVYGISIFVALGLYFFLSETKQYSRKQEMSKLVINSKTLLINISAAFVMVCYLITPTQLPFLIKVNFPDYSASIVGMLLALWIFLSSVASIFYSRIRKSMSFRYIYMLGFLIWAVGFVLTFFASNISILALSLAISGVGNGLVVPNLKAHILDLSDIKDRGRHSGLLTMSLYIGQFLSPLLVQPLLSFIDISAVFLVFSGLLIVASLLYLKIKK